MVRTTPTIERTQDYAYHRFKVYAKSAWRRSPRNWKLVFFVLPSLLLFASIVVTLNAHLTPSSHRSRLVQPYHQFPFGALGAECDAYLLPAANAPQTMHSCSLPLLNDSLPIQPNLQHGQRKMVIVLDFWERMVNVQTALRRLVELAVDADFTVVEPLMYESHVVPEYSFSEQFETRNMVPQTAALYFQTDALYNTNRYISHREFLSRTRGLQDITDAGRTIPVHHIETAVFIDWDGTTAKRTDSNSPFYWCDHILRRRMRKTSHGWSFTKNVYFQRAICLSPAATMSPANFTRKLFDDIFSLAHDGTERKAKRCQDCVSLAFLNYRKHAFSGFVYNTGNSVITPSTLPVGKVPLHFADTVRREQMNGHPYVAIQIRTGKPFVLFKNYEKREPAQKGLQWVPFWDTDHQLFKTWLKRCTRKLVIKAREVAQDLGPNVAFYIASDMYNNGWKGGERCPWSVKLALEAAKKELARELRPLVWLEPEMLQIEQDVMGMCGLMDAAICVKADRFVFSVPSNFGSWVRLQREMNTLGNQTYSVNCEDDRFGPH